MRPARLLVLLALLPPVLAAAPGSSSVSLELAPEPAVYGETVGATGALSADPPCLAGRPVRLERLGAGLDTWEAVAETVTAADGAFAFELIAESNAAYRAMSPPSATGATVCAEELSAEVPGSVRVAVATEVARPRWTAGSCRRVEVSVSPAKPGHAVVLERRAGGGWSEVVEGELGPGSRTRLPLCTTWSDLGTLVVRAAWPEQDDLHEAAASEPFSLRIVRATWMRRLDRAAGGSAGISVREEGAFLYRHRDTRLRAPASNEKLLLSMALLDELPPETRLPTGAMGRLGNDGVVRGDLWLVGGGDPEVGRADLGRLAQRLRAAGVRRVAGSVRGSNRGFVRDWWARGWRPYFPARYIARPTALTFQANAPDGRHLPNPELPAAAELSRQLRRRGIAVAGKPGSGAHPRGLEQLAQIESRPLGDLLATTNTYSSNFRAEVLGKLLGDAATGEPGSIARGARAIESWARERGVRVRAFDSSGLSYANRASPAGLARLLGEAEAEAWGEALREGLAAPGRGTLEHRLAGVPVRAKTGTLTGVSALSGWVRTQGRGAWVEFSVISTGMPTWRAKALEDAVVRALWRRL